MSKVFKLLYLLSMLFVVSCTPHTVSNPSNTVTAVDASMLSENFIYKMGSGDKIKVTVYQEKDLSGEFEIDSRGYISLPYIQEIKAAGFSARELSKNITQTFVDKEILRDPRVSVEVLNYRPFYIHGEVNQAGEFPYKSNMDVRNAVATAGGYTYRADENSVYIRREGANRRMRVNIKNGNFPIYPGDNIEIPERFF